MRNNAKDIRTLCYRCKQQYEAAGYHMRPVLCEYKEKCEICGNNGYDYEVLNGSDKGIHKNQYI